MIKILSSKRYKAILAEIEESEKCLNRLKADYEELLRQHQNLHRLHKGLWNRLNAEVAQREDRIKELEKEVYKYAKANKQKKHNAK